MSWHKIKFPRYYQIINGVKTEVVQQRFAQIEYEEIEVDGYGSRKFIEASKKLK